jgi:hypothetical protein
MSKICCWILGSIVALLVLLGLCAVLFLGIDFDRLIHPQGKFIPDNPSVNLDHSGSDEFSPLVSDGILFREPDGTEWLAPTGTRTDGASVPRAFLPVTDGRFDKAFLRAAIVHDAYCQQENEAVTPEQYRTRPWRDTHKMFYRACRAGGTSESLASAMFAAVWLRGPRWHDPVHELRSVSAENLRIAADSFESYFTPETEEVPPLGQLVSWVEEAEQDVRTISRIETEWNAALDRGDDRAADAALASADRLLKRSVEQSPNRLVLQNLQGYHRSHRAERLKQLGRSDEAAEELDRAETIFKGIRDERPADPSADKGLHRIEILRSRPELVEPEVRRDIEEEPDHPVARRNLEMIESNIMEPHPVEPPHR